MVDVCTDVRTQLLSYFHSHPGENVKTIDLCRVIKQPKKAINSVLYRLQRDGVLQKVVESPPTWRETNASQSITAGPGSDGNAAPSLAALPGGGTPANGPFPAITGGSAASNGSDSPVNLSNGSPEHHAIVSALPPLSGQAPVSS